MKLADLLADIYRRNAALNELRLELKAGEEVYQEKMQAYNEALGASLCLNVGMIVVTPSRYSWTRKDGATETVAIVGWSKKYIGKAVCRVVTMAGKLNKGAHRSIGYQTSELVATGRTLAPEDMPGN
jgi:hypothetical protein